MTGVTHSQASPYPNISGTGEDDVAEQRIEAMSGSNSVVCQKIMEGLAQALPKRQGLAAALRHPLQCLSQEQDPTLLFNGLLHLAQRWKAHGSIDAAAFLFRYLSQNSEADPSLSIPSSVQVQAQREFDALAGKGDVGMRLEFLVPQIPATSLDFKQILPMVGASMLGSFVSGTALSRLLNFAPGLLTRGVGVRVLAGSIGFLAEFPAFAAFHRALNPLPTESFSQELGSSAISLGAMKLFGVAGQEAGLALQEMSTRWPSLLQSVLPRCQGILNQGTLFGGLLAAHRLEQAIGWRDPLDGATTMTDTLSNLISLQIGGEIGERMTGESWARFREQLHFQSELGGKPKPKPGQWFHDFAVESPLTWMFLGMGVGGGGGKKKPPAFKMPKTKLEHDVLKDFADTLDGWLRTPDARQRRNVLLVLAETLPELEAKDQLEFIVKIAEQTKDKDPVVAKVAFQAIKELLFVALPDENFRWIINQPANEMVKACFDALDPKQRLAAALTIEKRLGDEDPATAFRANQFLLNLYRRLEPFERLALFLTIEKRLQVEDDIIVQLVSADLLQHLLPHTPLGKPQEHLSRLAEIYFKIDDGDLRDWWFRNLDYTYRILTGRAVDLPRTSPKDLQQEGSKAPLQALGFSALESEAVDAAGQRYILSLYKEGDPIISNAGGPWIVSKIEGQTHTLRHRDRPITRTLEVIGLCFKENDLVVLTPPIAGGGHLLEPPETIGPRLIHRLKSPDRNERLSALWPIRELAEKMQKSEFLNSMAGKIETEFLAANGVQSEFLLLALIKILPYLDPQVAPLYAFNIAERMMDPNKEFPVGDISNVTAILPYLTKDFRKDYLLRTMKRKGEFSPWEKEFINWTLEKLWDPPVFPEVIPPKPKRLPPTQNPRPPTEKIKREHRPPFEAPMDQLLANQISHPQGRRWNYTEPPQDFRLIEEVEEEDEYHSAQPLDFSPKEIPTDWEDHQSTITDPDFYLPIKLEGTKHPLKPGPLPPNPPPKKK